MLLAGSVSALLACGAPSDDAGAITRAGDRDARAERAIARWVAHGDQARALPVLTDSSARGFGLLLADTLELDRGGRGSRAVTVRRVDRALGVDTVYHGRERTQWREEPDGRILVGLLTTCPDAGACPALDVARLVGDELHLASHRLAAGGVLVMRRAPR